MTTVTVVRKSAYHNSVPLPALARGLRARTRDRGGRADKTSWRQALRDPLRGPKLNVMRAGDWSAIKDQSRERGAHRGEGRGPAHDAALRAHHLERGLLEGGEVALGGVLHEQTLVAAVVGLPHRGLHAHLGGHAGEEKVRDALASHEPLERPAPHPPPPSLPDHRPPPPPR